MDITHRARSVTARAKLAAGLLLTDHRAACSPAISGNQPAEDARTPAVGDVGSDAAAGDTTIVLNERAGSLSAIREPEAAVQALGPRNSQPNPVGTLYVFAEDDGPPWLTVAARPSDVGVSELGEFRLHRYRRDDQPSPTSFVFRDGDPTVHDIRMQLLIDGC